MELQTSPSGPKNFKHSISDIMDMLKSMPNNEALKKLLDFSIKWTKGCSGKWAGGLVATNEGGDVVEVSERMREVYNVLKIACSPKDGARILAAMVPDLLQMPHSFTNVTSSVLHNALGFETLVCSIKPFLENRFELAKRKKKMASRSVKPKSTILTIGYLSDLQ